MASSHPTSQSSSWTVGTKSGLVSIGDYSLFLRASGPVRNSPSDPVVIIENGLGSSSSEWVAVQPLIAKFARVHTYDRAGYGQSRPLHPSASPPTLAKRCSDLTKLLEAAGIDPPWVLVGHSYGGSLVRQFLYAHGKEKVKGMVIVDSAVDRIQLPESWPSLLGDAKYQDVAGLSQSRVLTDEQWEQVQLDDVANEPTADEELKVMKESMDSLNAEIGEKQLLGDGRLSIMFNNEAIDFRKIYEWGVEHGNGTEEAREELRKYLETMSEEDEKGQRAHLTLSSQGKFVYSEGIARTHNIQFVKPEAVAEQVRWVLGLEDD